MEKRTLETVLADVTSMAENRIPISPQQWLQSAQFLNLFLEEETIKHLNSRKEVAKMKLNFLEQDPKKNVSQATLKIEATDEYYEMKKQEAKIEQIIEYIRIAKQQARMTDETIRGK